MSQFVDLLQVFCETDDDEQAEVDVVDEGEEDEILVNQMVNDNTLTTRKSHYQLVMLIVHLNT